MIARLVAALVLPSVVSCTAASVPPSETSPVPSAGDVSPSPSPSPEVADLDLATQGFWRLGWTDDLSNEAENALRIGLLNGVVTASIESVGLWQDPLTNAPIIRGPAANVVLYGRPSGAGVDLHLVNVLTGADRTVANVPGSVDDAEIAPDATSLYWIDQGERPGVWQLDPATGARQRLLPQPAVAASGIVLARGLTPHAKIALSADGQRLAALWCGSSECALQVVDLVAGAQMASRQVDASFEVGFAAAGIRLSAQCIALPSGESVESCGEPDANLAAEGTAVNFAMGVELPAGWSLEIRLVPDAPMMSFEDEAWAVPSDGREPILLEALGHFAGQ